MLDAGGSVLLLALVGACVPVCAYLAMLTVIAPFGLRRSGQIAAPQLRFRILVPAHDEAEVISRLLDSLNGMDYPRRLFSVGVVADNCRDRTASVAASAGADVFERHDEHRIGKGWALDWLLGQSDNCGRGCDAYVVIDADSEVSPNFLQVMNDRMLAGAEIVQAYYTVLRVRQTSVEALREASLALVHFLRPAAKVALGVSCGLKGNGMAFRREILDRYGWPTRGLAEDVEFHLALVSAGYRVEFAPEAVLRAEMPSSLRAAESQNRRWEAGRLQALRTTALPLFLEALRRRSLTRLDAAIEQCVPPLSVPAFILSVTLVMGLAVHLPAVWALSAVMLMLLTIHLATSLVLARVSSAAYRALAALPLYVVWKAVMYLRLMVAGHEQRWIRTPREAVK